MPISRAPRPWADVRYIEDLGAVGNGVVDSTAAIQAAATSGLTYRMKPYGEYVVSSRISCAAGFRLIGDGTQAILATSAFNNTSLNIAQRYAANSVVFYATGLQSGLYTPLDGFHLEGFAVRPLTTLAGKAVDVVAALNVKDFKAIGLEMSGFSLSRGIRFATLSGDSQIVDNFIHDFTDNTDWGVGTVPQITAVEGDNDRVNGVGSFGVRIENLRVWDMTVGATFLAAHNYQTDGLNIVGATETGKTSTTSGQAKGLDIRRVGEGVDHFGDAWMFSDTYIEDAYIYGFKLIHGASFNNVQNLHVYRAGLASVVIAGTSISGGKDTKGNKFSGAIILRDVDPNGVFAANSTANIALIDNAGLVGKPVNNTVEGDCYNGANGKYNYLDSSTGSGNVGKIRDLGPGATKRVLVQNGASIVRSGKPTLCRVYLAGAQNAVTAAYTKILFDTVSFDHRGEWDAVNNRWLCQMSGYYSFSAKTRIGTSAAGKVFTMSIYKDGALISVEGENYDANDLMVACADKVFVLEGSYVDARIYNGDTVDRAMTVGSAYTSMTIESA